MKSIFFLCILLSTQCLGQGSIQGVVSDEQNQQLSSITIQLNKSIVLSDQDGFFAFKGLASGDYLLKVSAVGYETFQQKIKIENGENKNISVVLKEAVVILQNVEITGRKSSSYKNDYSFSATKTATAIIDIPQSISTVTKELIRDQQAIRLKDIVQNVAGVNQFSTYDDITMRGFRSFSSRLVNGMRTYNNFWTSPLLVNIERVEFIKGPASAVFANTNPGGTINMVTKKPLPEFRNALSFSTGSFNTFRAMADFTGPLNKEKTVLYRMNLGYENAESFRDNYFNKNLVIAPSISFIPREGTRFNADLVYTDMNTILDRGRPTFQGDRSLLSTPINFNLTQPGDFLNQDNLSVNFSFEQQVAKNISFNASYLKYRFDEDLNEHGFNRYLSRDSIELYFTDRLTKAFTENISSYFTINVTGNKVEHKILFGYDYISGKSVSLDRYAEGISQGVPNFSLTTPEYYRRPVSSYIFPTSNYSSYGDRFVTNGIYVQDQIKIGKIQALLSLRQEFYKFPKDQSTYYGAYGTPVDRDLKQNALIPKIGLIYSIRKNINIYATYTGGFESQDIFMYRPLNFWTKRV